MEKYRSCLKNKKFLGSLAAGLFLLVLSLVVNYYAGVYATERASNAVTDIILSNIRVMDVDWLFVYGSIIFWLFVIFLWLHKPHRIPFAAKGIALFVFIRAIFISLTHIGPFPTQLIIDSALLNKISFGGDLFFSGHVGLPFLFALMFWKNIRLRYFFIASSILFSFVVLLGHLHYSIDVLSAFFITYTIHRIAEIFFKEDRELFLRDGL